MSEATAEPMDELGGCLRQEVGQRPHRPVDVLLGPQVEERGRIRHAPDALRPRPLDGDDLLALQTREYADAESRPRELANEALWLGHLVVSSLPDEPEALGPLALMLHAEARRAARRNADGDSAPLAEQDLPAWDAAMIQEAEQHLTRANRLVTEPQSVGRFQLEAAIQSAHAARLFTGRSDWDAIVALYGRLATLIHSPVVAVNRAVALAELREPSAGLEAFDQIADEPRLAGYQPFWAARAELLARSGQNQAATQAYEHAMALEIDPAVRRFLERRRARLKSSHAQRTSG